MPVTGTITRRMVGDQVRLEIRLHRAGSRLFYGLMAITITGLCWMGWQVFYAFVSGRVTAILESHR
jgi:hypothetical protein